MMNRSRLPLGRLALLALLVALPPCVFPSGDSLPSRLSDGEFRRIIETFSEQAGYFRSDNLLSNENWLQYPIADLLRRTGQGGVYLGVGPEQNFTYIAALKPRIAFIIDIRRGNLHTHLMYKALFELSSDRADFVSMLFSRPRPSGLRRDSSADEIFKALWNVEAGDEPAFQRNLASIQKVLIKKHGLALSKHDLSGLEGVYRKFHDFGPGITYLSSVAGYPGRGEHYPTYAELMTGTDGADVHRSYLASEQNFKTVRDLEERNLIVPLVGDFAGPKTIRAVAEYLKEHHAAVGAFYLSNVEFYLEGVMNRFCGNVDALPADQRSTLIRYTRRDDLPSALAPFQDGIRSCKAVH